MKKKQTAILWVVVLCGLALVGYLLTGKKEDGSTRRDSAARQTEIVARVGNTGITVDDLEKEMKRRRATEREKEKVLEEMIEYHALLANARDAGLDKDPEVLRAWNNILVGKYRAERLGPVLDKISVTPEEARQYYQTHKEEFTIPQKIRLAILFLSAHSKMPQKRRDAIREKMENGRKEAFSLSDEKGFGKLSIAFSEHQPSRYKGGDIGWVRERGHPGIDPAAVEAGFGLKNIGDISDVISTDRGFYVVKLIDRRLPGLVPFEDVERKINQSLLIEKKREAEEAFLEKARAGMTIETYPELLARVRAPEEDLAGRRGPPGLP